MPKSREKLGMHLLVIHKLLPSRYTRCLLLSECACQMSKARWHETLRVSCNARNFEITSSIRTFDYWWIISVLTIFLLFLVSTYYIFMSVKNFAVNSDGRKNFCLIFPNDCTSEPTCSLMHFVGKWKLFDYFPLQEDAFRYDIILMKMEKMLKYFGDWQFLL